MKNIRVLTLILGLAFLATFTILPLASPTNAAPKASAVEPVTSEVTPTVTEVKFNTDATIPLFRMGIIPTANLSVLSQSPETVPILNKQGYKGNRFWDVPYHPGE